jgi:hypothetical protein
LSPATTGEKRSSQKPYNAIAGNQASKAFTAPEPDATGGSHSETPNAKATEAMATATGVPDARQNARPLSPSSRQASTTPHGPIKATRSR